MMKTPMTLILAGWALFLGGCVALSQGDLVPTLIPTPRSGNKCFEPIGVMPGKNSKEEVLALLGKPDEVISWFDQEEWWYSPFSMSILFSAELVNRVYQYDIPDCTLGDIIGTLGPPEIIEVITQNNLPGPPVYPSKRFYYPSRGMMFLSPCPGALEWQACSSFRATDEITRREFYVPTTVEELVRAAQGDPYTTFLEWNGFTE